ncbi:hypothetical protein [Streptomyces sp. H27-D2]|nr:hypothetical protein [Streptomyces sp. H27-D2]MEC4017766.1 hypothetical protein [Streptomyces sp. H27-D2]
MNAILRTNGGGDGGNGDKLPGGPWPVPDEKSSPDGGPRVVARR